MLKKLLCVLLTATMVFGIVGCSKKEESNSNNQQQQQQQQTEAPAYKIGIVTGTVSQGEEELRAAQKMKETYGDMIVTATYPDNFSTETETTIATVAAMASDPDVKAIVFVQAVPGASAAIDKVRETRPDMLFICGVVAEDPATVASKADICMLVDEISMGRTVIEQAAKMGAKTFIHYSFARHLSYATISARRTLFMETCKELGIEYVDANAPDPTGDSGVPGAQQFILEDVPRKVAEYGVDTAFFSTNCSMQEPLIRSVLEEGAIFPQQCCPSPYHGYPAALGIDVSGHEGDVQYLLEQITEKVAEAGNTGRMSTWKVPVNMLMVEAGVKYAIEYCEGRTNGTVDEEVFFSIMDEVAGGEGACTITKYQDEAVGELDNFYMILCDFYTF